MPFLEHSQPPEREEPVPAKPWLIGESNPYQEPGSDREHRFDLYPLPEHSAGGRLCKLILGLPRRVYLVEFVRRNLLAGKWSAPLARQAAAQIKVEAAGAPLILLGAKVAAAFCYGYVPFTAFNGVAILPHPSGRAMAWNEPDAIGRARVTVLAVAPHLKGVLP
jgi:hypothetical protein